MVSSARKHFKKRIGQVNHFLITTLVGLDGVKCGNITLSPEFSTSWNPRDVNRSVDRSTRFILDASLSWVVDNLDSYFVEANRKPSIIQNEELQKEYDFADRSVNKRFELFYKAVKKTNNEIVKYASLVALAIQWRNNTVHFGAENKLDKEYEDYLLNNKEIYINEFRHLDVESMMSSFKSSDKHPSFKEVTSMISAIHKFVECVDDYLISNLDIERFKKDILEKHYSLNMNAKVQFNNFTESRKNKYFETLFRQYGFDI